MKTYKLAIVGATGVVGRTALKVLEEKNLENLAYTLFASKKSSGKKIRFMEKDYIIHELKEDSFNSGFDFAIFCAGGETSKKFAPIASQKGCIVIDNSSTFRMDENIPLIVPEVNFNIPLDYKGIIANPNCSTIQAVTCLKPLDDKYNIKRIVYSTYQAVSGAGKNGIYDLEIGIKNYIENISDKTYLKKFPLPIFNNCLPHIDVFMKNGYTKEEEKMINETRKILQKPNLSITATTVRVPVFNSHSESINVEFEKSFNSIEEVKKVLKDAPGIKVIDDISENKYPTTLDSNGTDYIYVGRIRKDYSITSGINLWVVADNVRKGAASNAVQILEKILQQRELQEIRNVKV